ncbi:hypothetical protein DB32_000534 [Sandaracinus amylolyticus]|uniref:Uncharacterized protein n=1 Tax=Sandaracinus amylolyticus TaxID=927083 RepID=A0A0F6YG82_9BACT|nr:hypothetical protein DB32_000534 [Sandaracinus amylolyticus]
MLGAERAFSAVEIVLGLRGRHEPPRERAVAQRRARSSSRNEALTASHDRDRGTWSPPDRHRDHGGRRWFQAVPHSWPRVIDGFSRSASAARACNRVFDLGTNQRI